MGEKGKSVSQAILQTETENVALFCDVDGNRFLCLSNILHESITIHNIAELCKKHNINATKCQFNINGSTTSGRV